VLTAALPGPMRSRALTCSARQTYPSGMSQSPDVEHEARTGEMCLRIGRWEPSYRLDVSSRVTPQPASSAMGAAQRPADGRECTANCLLLVPYLDLNRERNSSAINRLGEGSRAIDSRRGASGALHFGALSLGDSPQFTPPGLPSR
jgi:hypothetical protein